MRNPCNLIKNGTKGIRIELVIIKLANVNYHISFEKLPMNGINIFKIGIFLLITFCYH